MKLIEQNQRAIVVRGTEILTTDLLRRRNGHLVKPVNVADLQKVLGEATPGYE